MLALCVHGRSELIPQRKKGRGREGDREEKGRRGGEEKRNGRETDRQERKKREKTGWPVKACRLIKSKICCAIVSQCFLY